MFEPFVERSFEMGFMDKVKSVAQDAANQAKVATSQAQNKIEQTQLTKKMDELARQLGHAVFNERAKGVPATNHDAVIEEMRQLETAIAAANQPQEAQGAPAAPAAAPVSHTDAAPTPPSTSASEPSSGDFKL